MYSRNRWNNNGTSIKWSENLTTSVFEYGIVPNDFCVALLVPILKKNTLDPNVPKNYRPITNTGALYLGKMW